MNRGIVVILFFLATACASNKFSNNERIDIVFNITSENDLLCDFTFPDPNYTPELLKLKSKYDLEGLVKNESTDTKKALILLNWTNGKWKHNSDNKPQKNNALDILMEAQDGAEFRCVEYGIVLSAALSSIGIPTRTLGIMTKDVETTKYGAGHVVSEAFIPDINKWVFMDGQLNYIPFLNNIPLNAIEYQSAILNNREQIELRRIGGNLNKRTALKYIDWVIKYLYYFSAKFDSSEESTKCNGKSNLMLVPLDAKKPSVFQIESAMDYCIYTNNVKDFYKRPRLK